MPPTPKKAKCPSLKKKKKMQKYVKFTSLEYAILVGHKYITKTPFLEIGMQCS